MKVPPLDTLVAGIRAGDRPLLARAITLVESERQDHGELAAQLLTTLQPYVGKAYRLGVSGTPGVGKSSFIERFGMMRVAAGRKVAVLAIDPSSRVSGGSILGDKTRMQQLAKSPGAYIRPSPTSGTLGGVARKTREAMLLCEAAGFDDVIVETVGVGQSETLVADMVDDTLLLLLASAGDGLQGIKRGILEAADMVMIHKADLDSLRAQRSARELASALRLMRGEAVPVVTGSSVAEGGLEALVALGDGRLGEASAASREARRRAQEVRWMWRLIEDGLVQAARRHVAGIADDGESLEAAVETGQVTARRAAEQVLMALLTGPSTNQPSTNQLPTNKTKKDDERKSPDE